MNNTKDEVHSVECDLIVNSYDLENFVLMIAISEPYSSIYEMVEKIVNYLRRDKCLEFTVATIPKDCKYKLSIEKVKNEDIVALLFDRITGYFENDCKFKIMYIEEVA